MHKEILICLAAVITPTLCNFDTYVYTEHCAPHFNTSIDVLTTPGSIVPVYPTLAPIERCCPQCEKCKHLGGTCHLKWALELYDDCICDFNPVKPCRDYSCQCCITCADDTCSDCATSGGECRTTCRTDELEDTYNLCSYNVRDHGEGCKCCKKCERTSECIDAYGTCRTNPNDCPHGTYPSTGCCLGCTCCKPVLTPINGTRCDNTPGSYCSETDECADGFFACFGECASTNFIDGLSFQKVGYCCVPKNAAPSPGRISRKFNHNVRTMKNKFKHNYDNLVAEQAHKIHEQNNRHPQHRMY